ncbi:serine hydrolase [Olsenella massiliensis]|uniref:serine hydrolase n=1 Tax=Olsenella massiliensis TaxID=1622075 RepID=UPI00071D95B4|nr:serine hydrolase [Olsenella massiliensis]
MPARQGRRRPDDGPRPRGRREVDLSAILADVVTFPILAARRVWRLARRLRRRGGRARRHVVAALAVTVALAALALALGIAALVRGCASPPPPQAAQPAAADSASQVTASASATSADIDVGSARLHVTSSLRGIDESRLDPVVEALRGLSDKGINVSLDLRTLDGNMTMGFRTNTSYYTASSIKGLYVCALFQQLVDTGQVPLSDVEERAQAAVMWSDNASYGSLRSQYGTEFFASWLDAAGMGMGAYGTRKEYVDQRYPQSTPEQLREAWEAIWRYLSSGRGASATLRSFFEQRERSPIKDALGDEDDDSVITLSKAGWFPLTEEQGVSPAANDAGVVVRPGDDGRSYVVAVMSDSSEDLEALKPLVKALDDYVCGG